MTNFLDLPSEIRDQIYEYVILGQDAGEASAQLLNTLEPTNHSFPRIRYINPRNGATDDDTLPGRELLLVSKEIHRECKTLLFRELTFYWDNPTKFLEDCCAWGDLFHNIRRVEFAATPLITDSGLVEHEYCEENIHEEATCKSGSWESELWEKAFEMLGSFESLTHFELILWKESWSLFGGFDMAKGLASLCRRIQDQNYINWQRDYQSVINFAAGDDLIPNLPTSVAQWLPEHCVDYLNHRRFWEFVHMLERVDKKGLLERADRIIDRKVSAHVNWLINGNGTNRYYSMTRRELYEVVALVVYCFKGELIENILH